MASPPPPSPTTSGLSAVIALARPPSPPRDGHNPSVSGRRWHTLPSSGAVAVRLRVTTWGPVELPDDIWRRVAVLLAARSLAALGGASRSLEALTSPLVPGPANEELSDEFLEALDRRPACGGN